MATETKLKVRFEHDCENCTYLGPYSNFDLYVCIDKHGFIQTVVARYGRLDDYKSGLAFVQYNPSLLEALIRAKALGFKINPKTKI